MFLVPELNLLTLWLVNEGKTTGEYKKADDILNAITDTQNRYGSEVMLSDNKIMSLLKEQGIKVARRTIAKYREMMTIPPSNERKRLIK